MNRRSGKQTNASVRHRLLEAGSWGEDGYKAIVRGRRDSRRRPQFLRPLPPSQPMGERKRVPNARQSVDENNAKPHNRPSQTQTWRESKRAKKGGDWSNNYEFMLDANSKPSAPAAPLPARDTHWEGRYELTGSNGRRHTSSASRLWNWFWKMHPFFVCFIIFTFAAQPVSLRF